MTVVGQFINIFCFLPLSTVVAFMNAVTDTSSRIINLMALQKFPQNTYMVAYDTEVEQYEVDECTDAEYFN